MQYRNRLEGAVVELHFELRHWSIGRKEGEPNSDTYIADVTQIRVLVSPQATSCHPNEVQGLRPNRPFGVTNKEVPPLNVSCISMLYCLLPTFSLSSDFAH
jgi:hypothetical protein